MSIKPAKPSETPIDDGPQKFPKPNTIPNGWDLSELMSVYNTPELVNDPQPTPVDLDCSAELNETYSL